MDLKKKMCYDKKINHIKEKIFLQKGEKNETKSRERCIEKHGINEFVTEFNYGSVVYLLSDRSNDQTFRTFLCALFKSEWES